MDDYDLSSVSRGPEIAVPRPPESSVREQPPSQGAQGLFRLVGTVSERQRYSPLRRLPLCQQGLGGMSLRIQGSALKIPGSRLVRCRRCCSSGLGSFRRSGCQSGMGFREKETPVRHGFRFPTLNTELKCD